MSRKFRTLITAPAAGLVFLTCLTVSGCQELVEPLPGPPDFAATVDHYAEREPGAPSDTHTIVGLYDVTVDGVPRECSPAGGYCPAQASLYCNDSTVVFLSVDGSFEEASLSDIAVGDWVEVWTTGAEARSDPPQYVGVQVIIVRD